MVRFVSVFAGVMALAACNGGAEEGGEPVESPTPVASEDLQPTAAPSATPLAERASNGSRSVAEETDDYLFEYSYPAAAGRIDALGTLLDSRLDEQRAALARTANEARRQARSDGFPYNKHSYTAEWKVVADVPGWVSLSNEFSTYTGGAHGNFGMESLVWNKDEGRARQAIDLFTSPAALEEALGDRFCDDLDRQRERRRGPVEDQPEDGGLFDNCPGMEELTVLVGSSRGRQFDRLTLYAGPYVAGPYAEGAYQVNLAVDQAVRDAVKPEFRESFASRN